MDQLTGIEVFLRVAARGSFSAAAAELGMSRAMVSKHVQALETRLGGRLLNRTTRRLSLTEAGRVFFEQAGTLVEALREAEETIGALQSAPRGELRVNAPVSFGARHLGGAVSDFMARYPEITVHVTLEDRQVDIVKEGYDLAIRIGRLTDSSLIARRLAPSRMLLLASPAYLERHGTPELVSDLSRHECLSYSYFTHGDEWHFDGPEGPACVRINGRLVANNGELLNEACLAGRGICLMPSFIAAPDVRAGRLVQILPAYRPVGAAVHALYPHARHLAPKVRVFIDHLVERFGGIPPWDEGLGLPEEPGA
ncbi:MAG TPA: LysR family transcriptional regulator [Kiloniellales bacterium]|nr:LysR family transcriptional regulator [Kiloniellales bacterium]